MLLKLLIVLSISAFSEEKELKKVLIFSRHNIRTPLSKNLTEMTPKQWPKWKDKIGYLTQKGAIMEGYMGAFFSEWLRIENLLPTICPGDEDFFAYANVKQRTMASAKSFVNQAFPNCNVKVHSKNKNETDPIFNPALHNTSTMFYNIVFEEMQEKLKTLRLNESYEAIENILDYKHSDECLKKHKCDLIKDKNKIVNIKFGEKPNISGPLKISNSVIDAFIMEYYEGFPLNNVAWGQLDAHDQWQSIISLSKGYHSVIFNTTLVAKDMAGPLINYISEILLENGPKVTLLMGHDANLYTLLRGMNFKPYTLEDQYELTPVGGKIVFQKWYDEEIDKNLLKVSYVYFTTKQIRNGLKSPPGMQDMELEGCPVDSNGFCLWDDFVKILNEL